ncbi:MULTISPECIES: oxidoreductase [Rhodococcus]|uniref:Oxidoreductase n=1 Tax=Rhodococcus oxybenzonivorans TaxID=1990687 RepID=A0AAE4V3C4_9NOCA|nr:MULTISPECIES: oxidoreductase [Rhodococcus]MDV7245237.1 oxidoreductase [Rhodococcus oxybenzonivorans]MDV7267580.1 oxidoreductase [Rhodococcus oxybenzonivorans]MDV7272483.1 oxidoreductase [Rhodococcus oxybenzonivorans]MDV7336262.1 oxidoreductase [Rhodococcus oxybenzonivorans]MDV7342947.1 oxidoreductase [Rhodococcus oxybenzonivorans]
MTTSTQQVALVTGASSGIGRESALALVKAGFTVVGTSRDASRSTPLDGVTFFDLDVSDEASVSALVEQVIARFGRIDVLVNNPGIGLMGAAEENSVAQSRGVFDINVFGVMRMTRAVLPHMRALGRGRIINLSSVYGLIPGPYLAAYVASKHAVEGYSESVDHEVREHGVRVLLVEPGGTNTGFEANSTRPDSPLPAYEKQRRIADQVLATSVEGGDTPATVARSVVAAATDSKPKQRYTSGPLASRVSMLRRFAPVRIFDTQMRKYHRLAN